MIKLDFLKSIAVKIKHHSAKTASNPVRDWQLILMIFCLVFLGTIFLSWKLNQIVTNRSVLPTAADKTAITINRALMDRVVNFYKNQERLFNQDKNARVDQGDPSK